jgi:hypothetical protein
VYPSLVEKVVDPGDLGDRLQDLREGLVDDEDEVHLAFEGTSAPVATYYLKRAPRC